MSTAEQKIVEVISTLQGDGIEAAKQAARMEAFSSLAAGTMWLAAAAGGVFLFRYIMRSKHEDKVFGAGLVLVLSVIAGLIGTWCFIDPRVYTTISHPEWWIAAKLLKL